LLFRWANALHIQTRPGVIQRALLFKSGDRVSKRLLDEPERLLRSNRYLYDVQFRAAAYHDGVVDIELLTRDTWSQDLGISAGRSGGTNSSGIHLSRQSRNQTGNTMADPPMAR
jgi:outer membrane protein assembly factor BamA